MEVYLSRLKYPWKQVTKARQTFHASVHNGFVNHILFFCSQGLDSCLRSQIRWI